MTKSIYLAAALGMTALVVGSGAARATGALTITPASTPVTDTFKSETNAGVTPGVIGEVGGTLNATAADFYNFTYLAAGDATFHNEFWVGASLTAAQTAGTVFCNWGCGFNAGNLPFTVSLSAGAIPYGLTFDQAGANSTLLNGQVNDPVGATLVASGISFANLPTVTPNNGPSPLAVVGLSDHIYPTGDQDFQDLAVQITVPEPASLALLGVGLAGLGVLRRRRRG